MPIDILKKKKRIVIKIGSALLVDKQHKLRLSWLKSLISDIQLLLQQGKQIIIVSSGSIALGREKLNFHKKMLQLPEKQAAAAVGQIELARAYEHLFTKHHIITAQMLLTLRDSEDRRRYINAKNTLNTLLELSAIPIINENDTVATSEIRYGDNDRLAARVAQMAEADCLILFSDIDGLYTANPNTHTHAKHLPIVEHINHEIEQMAGDSLSNIGTGGMTTKIAAAKIATASGADLIICNGQSQSPLNALIKGGKHTIFKAQITPHNAKKQWIAHHLDATGFVMIDAGAEKALFIGKSLLSVGVSDLSGQFLKGDVIQIQNQNKQPIAMGISNYSAEEVLRIKGIQLEKVQETLGYCSGQPIVHRNNLVLTKEK